jgi:hypothetical protein
MRSLRFSVVSGPGGSGPYFTVRVKFAACDVIPDVASTPMVYVPLGVWEDVPTTVALCPHPLNGTIDPMRNAAKQSILIVGLLRRKSIPSKPPSDSSANTGSDPIEP